MIQYECIATNCAKCSPARCGGGVCWPIHIFFTQSLEDAEAFWEGHKHLAYCKIVSVTSVENNHTISTDYNIIHYVEVSPDYHDKDIECTCEVCSRDKNDYSYPKCTCCENIRKERLW